jgi:hypothetical protein
MADELRLGGLGLIEEFPVPPIPLGAQSTPSVPIPLDAELAILGGDVFF